MKHDRINKQEQQGRISYTPDRDYWKFLFT